MTPQIADGVDLPAKPTDLTPAQAALFDLCVNQIVGDHVNGTTSGRLYIVSLLAAAAKRDALIVIGAGLAIPASDVPMVVGLFKGLV